jgi:hypothetical protein
LAADNKVGREKSAEQQNERGQYEADGVGEQRVPPWTGLKWTGLRAGIHDPTAAVISSF